MPETVVLDSSAIIAVLRGEPGSEQVHSVMTGGLLCTVNLAEVHSRLLTLGIPKHQAWTRILNLECEDCPFTVQLARTAAELIPITRPFGLSLGDRACLALAIERKAKVYTTDRAWKELALGIEIEVIR